MNAGRRSAQFRVFGRVQGVGFRHFVRATAENLGLSGWVRNRADGSVEVRAEGSEAAVAALIAACQKGPRVARVDRIEMEDAERIGPGTPAGAGFHTLPTV